MDHVSRALEAITGGLGSSNLPVTPFDLHFPLPYRICAVILLGIWGWGINVRILTAARVDVGHVVKYSFKKSSSSAPHTLHHGIFHMALVLTMIVASSWLIFSLILLNQYHNMVTSSSFTSSTVRTIDVIPETTLVLLIGAFIMPGQSFHSKGRKKFLQVLGRILLGRIDQDSRVPDILVADGLTSYTRVLNDMGVTICMFFAGHSCVGKPDRDHCSGPWIMGLILSVPYVIRFRQCIVEYLRTGANTHLVNSMKYGSALPVVVFGAMHKTLKDKGATQIGFTEGHAFRMWAIAAFVHSMYSFIWDVTCDWNLELLTTSVFSYKYKGLRKSLSLRPIAVYYLAVLIDFVLRMTWVLKLTSSWSAYNDLESSLFMLELLEIFRRIVWMCVRIEKEWLLTFKAQESLASMEMDEYKTHLHAS